MSRLGLDNAKRLFLTAETLNAQQMREVGFLTHLVAASELEVQVAALVNTCASMAPIALLGMKLHLNRIARGTLQLEDLEADISRSVASADLREGQAAWAQKRAPRFSGKQRPQGSALWRPERHVTVLPRPGQPGVAKD